MPTILLIDDEESLRADLVLILQLEDYETIEAGGGEEGLAIAEAAIPDLIISDVKLPDVNGVDLARLLRANPQTEHIPILMITAHSDWALEQDGIAAGANHFLRKPFSIDAFLNVIKTLLQEGERREEE